MDKLITTVVLYLAMLSIITNVYGLSGQICTRERAENYLESYNQAFLCQERYTTSCGQLDWRRCTRYRVQTCFTPKQRYMTRYRQVEECCSGWREDGSGQCTLPVCSRECQNGGSCAAVGNMPRCICQEGFYGDTCQHAQNEWKLWHTVAVSCGAVVLIIVIIISIIISQALRKTGGYQRLPQQEMVAIRFPNIISTHTTSQTQPGSSPQDNNRDNAHVYPTAPALNCIPPE